MPEDKWNRIFGHYDGSDVGCLVCHAFDCRTSRDYFDHSAAIGLVEVRFMDLSRRFGDARIGHLISERASRVLRERRKVPVSVHVSLSCEPVEVAT